MSSDRRSRKGIVDKCVKKRCEPIPTSQTAEKSSITSKVCTAEQIVKEATNKGSARRPKFNSRPDGLNVATSSLTKRKGATPVSPNLGQSTTGGSQLDNPNLNCSLASEIGGTNQQYPKMPGSDISSESKQLENLEHQESTNKNMIEIADEAREGLLEMEEILLQCDQLPKAHKTTIRTVFYKLFGHLQLQQGRIQELQQENHRLREQSLEMEAASTCKTKLLEEQITVPLYSTVAAHPARNQKEMRIQRAMTSPSASVFVLSKSNVPQEELRRNITKVIDPARDKIRIKDIRKAGSTLLVIEAASEIDIKRLEEHPKLAEI